MTLAVQRRKARIHGEFSAIESRQEGKQEKSGTQGEWGGQKVRKSYSCTVTGSDQRNPRAN